MGTWLLNAAHMKAVPGRKSDVKDAEWIAQLLEHGLVAPSFVPPPEIRRLRNLTRYRVQLMGDRTRDAVRLEQLLEDASIKLSAVASSVTTVSARAMLAELVAGNRDAAAMADLAHSKMRRKMPGPDRGADRALRRAPRAAGRGDAAPAGPRRGGAGRAGRADRGGDGAVGAQLELLQTIPGVGLKTAQVIIAETGGDMAQFPTAAHLAAWAGVAPAMHESAGKRTRPGHARATSCWPRCWSRPPRSVSRTKNTYLGAQYAQIASRRGKKRAAVAVAHSMLVSAYYMLQRDEPYREVGNDWFDQRHADAHTRRLVAQLKRLGHTVVLDPADSPA